MAPVFPCARQFAFVLGLFSLWGMPALAQQIQWRTSYNQARQEAKEKNLPIFMDFGTDNCFWCDKLDATTFRDPAVVQMINSQFIPIKIHASKHPSLVKALNIHGFPTLVFATGMGKVVGVYPGYMPPAQFQGRAQQMLALLNAEEKKLNPSGIQLTSGMQKVTPPVGDRKQQAKIMLAQAEEEFRTEQFISCLIRCKIIAATFPDLEESMAARKLAVQLKSDPERVQLTCDQMASTLCELYMDLAVSWAKQGNTQKATPYLQWIVQSCPNTPQAEMAANYLQQLSSSMAPVPSMIPPLKK